MSVLERAIDRALQVCGTQTQLGFKLGVSPQRITDWKTGIRPCPAHQLAAIARLAAMEPAQLIGDYAIERAKKKGTLARAAGVLLASIAGAVGTAGYIEPARAESLGTYPDSGVVTSIIMRMLRCVASLQRKLACRMALEAPSLDVGRRRTRPIRLRGLASLAACMGA